MQVKSNIGDVVPGYDGLHGGVVKCPVVIQLSQVVPKSFIHFKPEKQTSNESASFVVQLQRMGGVEGVEWF